MVIRNSLPFTGPNPDVRILFFPLEIGRSSHDTPFFHCYFPDRFADHFLADLHLPLHEIRGPTCFNDLKKVSGIVHPTLACIELDFWENIMYCDHTLEEGSIF